jgi:hypothetical protein
MIDSGFAELWRGFNAAGGTPVLTAFGGVIVTGIIGYVLQERKSRIEDRRQQRDAKRSRGEELYHLFDDWLVNIREAAEELKWKIQTSALTLEHIKAAFGDQQAYRRIIMLANIDFSSITGHLEELGKTYTVYCAAINEIGAEPDEAIVVPPIDIFLEVLNSTGDKFQQVLIDQMKALYD